ncbi:aminoglycoside phosphotransferase family protein [Neobacillus dielmonensis]|uniref:aminoglycoside phosphotransferase family protein n=1 Tax=Neobacillus dielmonensis TaxID=1347369 RepID=UPI0005A9F1EE|nr:aminoglycoside phosphotransferase family protein [Neobacillus dielmonensis]
MRKLPWNIVTAEGRLNDKLIRNREVLYKGLNGRLVERFVLENGSSYIFKPLTQNKQLGKEVWVYDHLLPRLPEIYPKLIAHSDTGNPETSWIILEDVGSLSHQYNEETIWNVTKWMARWHSLPVETFADIPNTGQKPRFENIMADVIANRKELQLPLFDINQADIFQVFSLLNSFVFSKKLVLSHGDLHLGNFAVAGERLVVLDWEHAHINSPFWDLYHLLDLSHPLFPKKMTSELRAQVLQLYLDEVMFEVEDYDAFKQEYYLYSAVFSMWMVGLIQRDLAAEDGKWPREKLENQLEETTSVLKQCLERLF